MMRKYQIKYLFEYGTGCLWSADEYTSDRFDWYIDPEKLPLSPETIARIYELADWYQSSLNWEYPPDPSPWEREEWDRFNQAADELFHTLQMELGEGFAVVNQQTQ